MRNILKTVLCLLAGFPAVSHAAGFTLTPGAISNLYSGALTLQVTGLTNGEPILVERFLDLNGNGTIESGDPLVQSFRLADGVVTSFAGVRNGTVPGDNDLTANGQISATIDFLRGPEFTRAGGSQIFRVSSPTGNFAPLQQILVVANTAYPQHVTGRVLNGSTPLPFALVAALIQAGNNSEFVAGTTADAAGNYSLAVTNGMYQMVAFSPGYFGSFATSPGVSVSGADVSADIPLTPGSFTASGDVIDTASAAGVPGIQFFASSANNEYAVFFSDAQGHFSVGLGNGQWQLEASDASLALGGYLRSQNKPSVSISGGNVTGMTVPCTREAALIYGSVKDDQNHPLAGVRLYANDGASLYQCNPVTDANGNYFVPAIGGTWYIGAENQGAGLPPNYTLQQGQVTITNGQAAQLNLVARQATAHLLGRATDSGGSAIGDGTMLAFGPNGENVGAQLASDGSFDLPVHGGSWTISLESQTAANHNVTAPQMSFNVTDGVNISNINYVAPVATRLITGSVKTPDNTGVGGLNVYAEATINSINYHANATTAADGSFSLSVLPGVWNVGVDSQALAQRGFGIIFNQSADTSSGNRTVNFVAGTPPVGIIYFRETMGVVGEFGTASRPTLSYPISFKNYRVFFKVSNDTNPPAPGTVLFSGPPGSGLTNTPADATFGVLQDGTNVYYSSPVVRNPSAAMGGSWTVLYRNNPNNFQQADPQVFSRQALAVPTITVSNDILRGVRWTYQDQNGNPIPGIPAFVVSSRLDVFDQNGNALDSQLLSPSTSYTFSLPISWSTVGLIRTGFNDNLGNQYFAAFSESSPTLTGPSRAPGGPFTFLLNGPPAQNYTIQYCTDLGLRNWTLLYTTNSATSPIAVTDANAGNGARFYRVLAGP